MKRTRAIDISLSFSILVAATLLSPTSTFGDQEPELIVALEAVGEATAAPLPVVSHAVFEVHVWGGTAVGRLTLDFSNAEETEPSVIYKTTNAIGVGVQRIETELSGAIHELQIESVEAKEEPSGRAARKPQRAQANSRIYELGRAASAPKLVTVQTEPFDLAAEDTTLVHTDLRWSIPLTGRIFRLTLPVIRPTGKQVVDSAAIPVQISVVVHHEQQLETVVSDSHQILVDFVGDKTIIEPVEREIPGDRPFEVRFAVTDRESPTVAGYYLDDGAGRIGVEAVMNPPEVLNDDTVRPKQLLFIVDSSGSMLQEDKMDQARRAVLSCIDKLDDTDQFNIIEFDHRYRLMSPRPVDLRSFDAQRVEEWLDTVEAAGSTAILAALAATLEQPEDPERHRMIVVVTDGYISDEEEALDLLREKLGEGRLFVVGTGRHNNQETLLRLAEYGRGAAVFAGDSSALQQAVEELYASISMPLGWDLELDLGSADVEEILPSRLPDLYAGRPVRIIAWVNGELPSRMSLRMSTVDGDRLFNVVLPPVAD